MRHLGILLLAALAAGCATRHPPDPASGIPQSLVVTSAAFADGTPIPAAYACTREGGTGTSPPLAFGALPRAASRLALIVDDPDAPGGTFTHWTLWDLPTSDPSLPAGADVAGRGGREGTNGAGDVGYQGMCPPAGPLHHYDFKAYALDGPLGLTAGASRGALDEALRGHVIAWGELVGTFRHP